MLWEAQRCLPVPPPVWRETSHGSGTPARLPGWLPALEDGDVVVGIDSEADARDEQARGGSPDLRFRGRPAPPPRALARAPCARRGGRARRGAAPALR